MARTKDGMQPIHLAAKYLAPQLLEILLEHGANPGAQATDTVGTELSFLYLNLYLYLSFLYVPIVLCD